VVTRGDAIGDGFDQLLGEARRGDGAAWTRLFEAYSPAVARYLEAQRAADVDALTNEVFLRAMNAVARFDGSEPSFRSWIFSIAHNLLVDEHRKRVRRPTFDPLDARHDQPNPEDALSSIEQQLGSAHVRAILDRLTPEQRDVLLLRVFADLSVAQIAAALGRTRSSVKALQHRAIQNVRRMLAGESAPR
jgi:RNA polymerase sigma-70 factor (ECF subfamily)